MEEQTIETITGWCEGRLLRGDPGLRVRGVSIDSRTVRPGELFIALPGRNFDGHDYIGVAFKKKAAAVILERVPERQPSMTEAKAIIQVESSERALIGLARRYRAGLDLRVIAITGSNGKTTTKNLIGHLLGTMLETMVAPASYNNRLGVSLTVLKIEKTHRAAVFELGMNRPGEILELGRLCRPQIGVILNVGPAHIGFLGGLEEVGRAKAELLNALEGEKVAVLNYDDPRVKAMAGFAPGPVVGFGIESPAPVRAVDVDCSGSHSEFDLSLFGRRARMRAPLPGLHNLYNLLAALAVAHHFGLTLRQMRDAVERVTLPPMRMEAVGFKGAVLINDAYNANPASMRAALAAWLQMPVPGRRFMVSGDMKELGDFAESEHFAWGKELGGAGVDYLVFVGELSRHGARGAVERGFPPERILTADGLQTAVEFLEKMVREGDGVLLKGSRAMGLEGIVGKLGLQPAPGEEGNPGRTANNV